ncbi:GTPase Era [Candidatus Poriferisocius sp.]|uniref:GTPase Era n=1 Tax=Candidatus Poriferisocius sp. TaxID=3101276 RepID=UPI003B013FE2
MPGGEETGDKDRWEGFRSGFVTLLGRPNSGKSTLVNAIVGTKVAIVSDKAQTTRHAVRGVLHRSDTQVVFVDTPGIHKPRTALGERLNTAANHAAAGVDVVCLCIDATRPLGRGDRFIAERLGPESIVVVTKIDAASRARVVAQLAAAGELGFAEYFPTSARTGEGVDVLVDRLCELMPPGPALYPGDMVSDMPEARWVAELVREQLLTLARDELPHSITVAVTEWDGSRIRVVILVERESQKPMVIGKRGSVLKEVGTAVRAQLPEGVFLELHVGVEKNWQRRPEVLDRLGYGLESSSEP